MSADDTSHYVPCTNMQYECSNIGADQQELVRVDNYMQGADMLRQDAIARNNFARCRQLLSRRQNDHIRCLYHCFS